MRNKKRESQDYSRFSLRDLPALCSLFMPIFTVFSVFAMIAGFALICPSEAAAYPYYQNNQNTRDSDDVEAVIESQTLILHENEGWSATISIKNTGTKNFNPGVLSVLSAEYSFNGRIVIQSWADGEISLPVSSMSEIQIPTVKPGETVSAAAEIPADNPILKFMKTTGPKPVEITYETTDSEGYSVSKTVRTFVTFLHDDSQESDEKQLTIVPAIIYSAKNRDADKSKITDIIRNNSNFDGQITFPSNSGNSSSSSNNSGSSDSAGSDSADAGSSNNADNANSTDSTDSINGSDSNSNESSNGNKADGDSENNGSLTLKSLAEKYPSLNIFADPTVHDLTVSNSSIPSDSSEKSEEKSSADSFSIAENAKGIIQPGGEDISAVSQLKTGKSAQNSDKSLEQNSYYSENSGQKDYSDSYSDDSADSSADDSEENSSRSSAYSKLSHFFSNDDLTAKKAEEYAKKMWKNKFREDDRPVAAAWQQEAQWTAQSLAEAKKLGYDTVVAESGFENHETPVTLTTKLTVPTEEGDITVLPANKTLSDIAKGKPTSDHAASQAENSESGRLARLVAQATFTQMESPYSERTILMSFGSSEDFKAADKIFSALEKLNKIRLGSWEDLMNSSPSATGTNSARLLAENEEITDQYLEKINNTAEFFLSSEKRIESFAADTVLSAQREEYKENRSSPSQTDSASDIENWKQKLKNINKELAFFAFGNSMSGADSVTDIANFLIDKLEDSISVEQPTEMHLLTTTANLPVTVTNRLPFPVTAGISGSADSNVFSVMGVKAGYIEAHSSKQIQVPVISNSAGAGTASLNLTDSIGRNFGKSVTARLNSSLRLSDKTGYIIIGLAIFLGIWGLWRQFNRVKDPNE